MTSGTTISPEPAPSPTTPSISMSCGTGSASRPPPSRRRGLRGAAPVSSRPPCLIRISRTPFCLSFSRNSSRAFGSFEPPGPMRVAAAWMAVARVL